MCVVCIGQLLVAYLLEDPHATSIYLQACMKVYWHCIMPPTYYGNTIMGGLRLMSYDVSHSPREYWGARNNAPDGLQLELLV